MGKGKSNQWGNGQYFVIPHYNTWGPHIWVTSLALQWFDKELSNVVHGHHNFHSVCSWYSNAKATISVLLGHHCHNEWTCSFSIKQNQSHTVSGPLATTVCVGQQCVLVLSAWTCNPMRFCQRKFEPFLFLYKAWQFELQPQVFSSPCQEKQKKTKICRRRKKTTRVHFAVQCILTTERARTKTADTLPVYSLFSSPDGKIPWLQTQVHHNSLSAYYF